MRILPPKKKKRALANHCQLLIRLLEGYPQMGEDYAPYTAVLGWERRNPKLMALDSGGQAIPETHTALQQRGQQFGRRVFQLIGYGTNRAASSRADGTAVLKLGMPGSHGLECLIAPRGLHPRRGHHTPKDSYTVAVILAVALRGLNLADLGQSNVANSDLAPWPKLRFIDMGSWLEDQPG